MRAASNILRGHGWYRMAAALLLTAVHACSTAPVQPPLDLHLPRGPEEWHHRLSALEGTVQIAKERYVDEQSYDSLQAYEDSARHSLEEGFALLREYRTKHRMAIDEKILADLSSSLNKLANEFVDVAEAYVTRYNTATGSAIASEFITRYTDLPLLAASLRAETLLFETRYRRDF